MSGFCKLGHIWDYGKQTICTITMTSIYLFLEDRDCFLLCEYEDDGAGGSGRRGVTKSGGSLPLLAFALSLAS